MARPLLQEDRKGSRKWIVAVAALGMLLVAGLFWKMNVSEQPPTPVVRFTVVLSADQALETTPDKVLDLSPKGTHLVYDAGDHLHLRPLDEFAANPLPGTEGSSAPFFSPDGQWIGFYQNGQLKKIAIGGGTPLAISPVQTFFGKALWLEDGTIVFGQGSGGIWQVSERGGSPTALVPGDATNGQLIVSMTSCRMAGQFCFLWRRIGRSSHFYFFA